MGEILLRFPDIPVSKGIFLRKDPDTGQLLRPLGNGVEEGTVVFQSLILIQDMADGNPIPVRFLRIGQKRGIPILLRKAGKFLFRIRQQAGKNLLILSAVQIILCNIQDKAYFFIFPVQDFHRLILGVLLHLGKDFRFLVMQSVLVGINGAAQQEK